MTPQYEGAFAPEQVFNNQKDLESTVLSSVYLRHLTVGKEANPAQE